MQKNQNSQLPLEQLREIRIDKLKKLRELGIDPYPSKSTIKRISCKKSRERKIGENVEIAGRITGLRDFGKLCFLDITDESGSIQISVKSENLKKSDVEVYKLFDIGDFIEASGKLFKTKSGEVTVEVFEIKLLSKSVRPFPSKHFGIQDEEERYRQRYVDLAMNSELKDLFRKKALFWNTIREFLRNEGFLEVETPVLENATGGADATPFVTHHQALDIDVYLRISMGELWQKRLMVAGFEKTFEIGRQFRNEGLSREHLQDYTQMEFYWAYANYEDSMALVEKMYKEVAKKTFGTLKFKIGEHNVNFDKKWERLDYVDTVKKGTGIDITKSTEDDLKKKLKELTVKFSESDKKGRLIDLLWKTVRKEISGPAFLVGHPVEVSPLAKRIPGREGYTERYQIILAGSEMGNGYSELNDPIDQAERFEKQQKMRDEGDDEAQMHDEDFVRALEYGMPPVTGFGVSERLFSFLADKSVRECVLFPLLKPEGFVKQNTKISHGSLENDDKYSISSAVKSDFPGILYAYTIVKDVDIAKSNPELEALKKKVTTDFEDMKLEDIDSISPISSYRELFTATGTDLHSKRPSPDALLRRIVQGKGLYNVNTAVDAYNLAVLETSVGLGGFDFDKIAEPVTLRYSQAGEKMRLLGDDKVTTLRDKQIVYSDANQPITVDMNYRDIDETKITLKTKNIILFADGAPGISENEVVEALEKGMDYIKNFCGGKSSEIVVIR